MDFAAANDWDGYFHAVAGKPPRDTLLKALDCFDAESPPATAGIQPRLAVDLACGEGRDTVEILRRGWRAIALDGHPAGIQMLRERIPAAAAERLVRAEVASFAEARWPQCDLLNCSFALPFCQPELFPDLWRRIVGSIVPGGRFSGQLFGDRDDWVRCHKTMGATRGQVEALFAGFAFDSFLEEEKDDKTSMGEAKHWHVFHVVARKGDR